MPRKSVGGDGKNEVKSLVGRAVWVILLVFGLFDPTLLAFGVIWAENPMFFRGGHVDFLKKPFILKFEKPFPYFLGSKQQK